MRLVPTRMGASTFINVTTEDLPSMQESLLGPTESQKAGTAPPAGDLETHSTRPTFPISTLQGVS